MHVGRGLTWPLARQAAEITLREVIAHTDAERASNVCQPSLGFQGPGTAVLKVCGSPLDVAGNLADLRVQGALPSTIGILALGAQNNPVPVLGGFAVPVPFFYTDLVLFDAQGVLFREGAFTAPAIALGNVFAQAAYYDPSLPQQWGLTNAIEIDLQ